MQDNYIGDIGDYGKYGLLRAVCAEKMVLSVNWYRVEPKKPAKQDDVNYLFEPQRYREYDPVLFDALHKVVVQKQERRIEEIEQANLFSATFSSETISVDRSMWHKRALRRTEAAKVVFLDPDNGLETIKMHQTNGATKKHVKWEELRDYYTRGQNVILYQHRPQMTAKDKCIASIMEFQKNYLMADCVKLLEFPKYTNRFYFMFVHERDRAIFEQICKKMTQKWDRNDFCREIVLG